MVFLKSIFIIHIIKFRLAAGGVTDAGTMDLTRFFPQAPFRYFGRVGP
jgi:hypothetical protein